jgi:hypothetical protein
VFASRPTHGILAAARTPRSPLRLTARPLGAPLQGKLIISQLGSVARVAVPMLLYFLIMFALSLALAWYTRMTYPYAAMQAFTASSNK